MSTGCKAALLRYTSPNAPAVQDVLGTWLPSAVGRLTTHSRINTIVLWLTHEAANQIKAMIVNVCAGVVHIRGAAPQLAGSQRWYVLARYIDNKILAFVPHTPIPAAAATG